MRNLAELYAQRCAGGPDAHAHDIFEHLPKLRSMASGVGHVTEFGVRNGNSTVALLMGLADRGGGVLVSYDIDTGGAPALELPPRVVWQLRQQDTAASDFRIDETDILFVDSCHDYHHVMKELAQHACVRLWIIMHDVSPTWGDGGPLKAMNQFLAEHPEWCVSCVVDNCNGLAVLARR